MSKEHFTHQIQDDIHVSMQALATFFILLLLSPLLLVLVVVSVIYLLSALLSVSGILG